MLRGFLYALALIVWVGPSVLYPQWTGWVYTRQSISVYGGKEPPGGLPMIWLKVPVSPARAPLWNPPGYLMNPNADVPRRWPWQPRSTTSYMEPSLGGIGFQITHGVLVLGLIFGWSYPFRARPPDYTAGVAIGAALGIVLGWILLLLLWSGYGSRSATRRSGYRHRIRGIRGLGRAGALVRWWSDVGSHVPRSRVGSGRRGIASFSLAARTRSNVWNILQRTRY